MVSSYTTNNGYDVVRKHTFSHYLLAKICDPPSLTPPRYPETQLTARSIERKAETTCNYNPRSFRYHASNFPVVPGISLISCSAVM